DARGRIWATTWNGGVVCLEGDRPHVFQKEAGLEWLDFNGSVEDAQGRIWIAGGGPGVELSAPLVYRFDEGTRRFASDGEWRNFRLPVMSLDGDRRGTIYFGCIGGILRLGVDGSIRTLSTDDGL